MFTRTKQFFNETSKVELAIYAASAGSLITTFYYIRVFNGMQLTDAIHLVDPETGKHFLQVTFKNGAIRKYAWDYIQK